MSDLRVVSPSEFAEFETTATGDREHVAGVLLAAGTSERFGGSNKLLADVDGVPVVRHAVSTLFDADVSPVVVVLGHQTDRVQAAIEDVPVTFVENPAYAEGQATSVRTGIESLNDAVDAAIIALGDMPYVDAASVDLLVDAYRAGVGTALASGCEGRRGNPVLFDSRHFDELLELQGDTGGRQILLDAQRAAIVETRDPGVLRDVDQPTDVTE